MNRSPPPALLRSHPQTPMAGGQHDDGATDATPRHARSASPPVLRVHLEDATPTHAAATTQRQRMPALTLATPNVAASASSSVSHHAGQPASPVPVLPSPPQAGSTRRQNLASASSRQQRLPTIPTTVRPSPYNFDDRGGHARTSSTGAGTGTSPPTPTLPHAQSTRHQPHTSSLPHSHSNSSLSASHSSHSASESGGGGGGGGGGAGGGGSHKPFVPQRRLARKHGRFQLWASGVLLSLALCHSLIGLITDSWLEDSAVNYARLEGKGTLQWVLVSLGTLCGLVAHVHLVIRFFGWYMGTRAKGSLITPKAIIIMWLVADAACLEVATRLYMSAGDYALRTGRAARFHDIVPGSGYNFVQDSFYYLIACIVLLTYHELDEWRLRRARAAERKKTVRERQEPHHSSTAAGAGAAARDREAGPSSKDDPHRSSSSPDRSHSGSSPDLEAGAHSSSSSLAGMAEEAGTAAVKKSDISSGGGGTNPDAPPALSRFSVVLHHDYLSPPQRRFVFAVSLFFVWIYLGAIVFTLVEGWNIRASADFCLTTLATIGFGNVTPRSTLGRCILFVYFPLGFASLGFAVNLVWQVVLAKMNSRVRHVSAWVAKSLANGCLGRHFGSNAAQKRKEATANRKRKKTAKRGESPPTDKERQPLSPKPAESPKAAARLPSKDAAPAIASAGVPSGLAPVRGRARPSRSTSPPSSDSSRSNSPSHGEDIGLTSPGATHDPRSNRPNGDGGGGSGARGKKQSNAMNIFELADEITHHEERERQRMEEKKGGGAGRSGGGGGKSLMNAATATASPPTSFRVHQRTESTDSTNSMHESHPLTVSHASQLAAAAASDRSHPPTPSDGSHPDRFSFSSITSRPGAPSISSARSSSSTASSGSSSSSRTSTSQLLARSAATTAGLNSEMSRVDEEDASGLASPPPPAQQPPPKQRSPVVPKLQPPPPPPPAPPAIEAPSPVMSIQRRPAAEAHFGRPRNLSPRNHVSSPPPPPPHLLVRTQSQPTAGPGGHSIPHAYQHPLSTGGGGGGGGGGGHSRLSSYSSDVRAYRDVLDRSTGGASGAATATRFPHHHRPHYPPLAMGTHLQHEHTGATVAASIVHEAAGDRPSSASGGGPASSLNIMRAMTKLQQKKHTTSVQLTLAFCFVLIWMLASSAVFSWSEGWTYFESFYFCYVCLTTIGFGDFVPGKKVANTFFLWFVILGLGAVIYLLSLVGELLTERFEERVLSRRKAQSAKARKKALLQELENQEAIFAPPESLLDHAQEFSMVTAELVARAKANMSTMKAAMTDLFTVEELQRYQLAFSALLRAEEKRKNTFDQAWMKAMQRVVSRPHASSTSSAHSGRYPPPTEVHSPSHSDREFEWSNVDGGHSYVEADPTLCPYQSPQIQQPLTAGHHSRTGSRGGWRSPPLLQPQPTPAHPSVSGRPSSLSPLPSSAWNSPYHPRRDLHHHASFDAPSSQPSSPIPEEENLGLQQSPPMLVDRIDGGATVSMSPRSSTVPAISVGGAATAADAVDPVASLYDPTPQPDATVTPRDVRAQIAASDQERLQPIHSPKSDDDDVDDDERRVAAVEPGDLEPLPHDLLAAMARHHHFGAADEEEDEGALDDIEEDDDDDDATLTPNDAHAGFEFDGASSEVDSDEENVVSEVRRARHAKFEAELDDEEWRVAED